MSAIDEAVEWHLTPEGWVVGTQRIEQNITKREPPDNRLLTLKCSEYLSSPFSKLERYKEEIWRAEGQDQLIAELLEKYGDKKAGYDDSFS